MSFKSELKALLNKYSKENESGTPDFILAEYIGRSLDNFNQTIQRREEWYGRGEPRPPRPSEVVKYVTPPTILAPEEGSSV